MECIDQDGVMTKDLALAMNGKNMKREDWVTTDMYMKAVNVRFRTSTSCFLLLNCTTDILDLGQVDREDEGESIDE